MYSCTEERFLENIKDHCMVALHDEGFYRHLSFTRNGSSVYRFDLITWPGRLCISGDCGTYVFSRLPDMFEFFRMDKADFNHSKDKVLNINPAYWGEKLESIDSHSAFEEYHPEVFKQKVLAIVEDWEFENDYQKRQVFEQVESEVLICADDGEVRAYDAAVEFVSEHGHTFQDFYEVDLKDYSFHYIWCLYAIVYGIQTYDSNKKQSAA